LTLLHAVSNAQVMRTLNSLIDSSGQIHAIMGKGVIALLGNAISRVPEFSLLFGAPINLSAKVTMKPVKIEDDILLRNPYGRTD
jgi:hypothetical protein